MSLCVSLPTPASLVHVDTTKEMFKFINCQHIPLLAPPPAILVVWLDMLNCILNLPEHTFSKRTIISQKSAGAKKVFVLLYENEYAYTRKRINAMRENGQCRKENLYLSIDLPLCFLISTTLNSTAINFGGISFDVYLGFSFALLRN